MPYLFNFAFVVGAQSVSAAPTLLAGLQVPISASFHPLLPAIVYIGGRDGALSVANLASPNPTTLPLTRVSVFSSQTSWHGLTSVHAATGAPASATFLYATYTQNADPACTDDGTNAGNPSLRPPLTVIGCPRTGALTRWLLAADGLSVGAPQTLWVGGCSQFGANGVNMVTSDAAGFLYVAVGAGANDGRNGGADFGQFGPQPANCTAPGSAWGGHFNALAPTSSGGKVLRFAPPTAATTGPLPAPTVFASGLHNPFRLTWARAPAARGAPAPLTPSLYSLDSGGASTTSDELNGPLQGAGQSYGWPCALGANEPVAAFAALPASPCSLLGPHTPAFYVSRATTSLGALEFHPPTSRWMAADPASGLLFSFSPLDAAGWTQAAADASTITEEAKAANPYAAGVSRVTQLMYVPASRLRGVAGLVADGDGALLAVDYGRGELRQILPVNGTTQGASGGAAVAASASVALFAATLAFLLAAGV